MVIGVAGVNSVVFTLLYKVPRGIIGCREGDLCCVPGIVLAVEMIVLRDSYCVPDSSVLISNETSPQHIRDREALRCLQGRFNNRNH